MLEFCHDAAEKTSFFCICCSKICKLQIKFLLRQAAEPSAYLCSVNGYLLTIRVSFPREGKALSILPILKELPKQLFLFYIFRYEQFME